MRWDYVNKKDKRDKQFIYDGKTLWAVEHGNMQVLRHDTKTSQLPGAIAFFLGAGSLSKDFNVAYPTKPDHMVPGATMLLLKPKQTNAAYAEIYLAIDPTTWTVARTTLIDSSGNVNSFELKSVDLKTAIPATEFAFDPKKDTPSYKVVNPSKQKP